MNIFLAKTNSQNILLRTVRGRASRGDQRLLDEFSFALVAAGLLLGLRHGIDWDHIAAISDLTSSQQQRLRGLGM